MDTGNGRVNRAGKARRRLPILRGIPAHASIAAPAFQGLERRRTGETRESDQRRQRNGGQTTGANEHEKAPVSSALKDGTERAALDAYSRPVGCRAQWAG